MIFLEKVKQPVDRMDARSGSCQSCHYVPRQCENCRWLWLIVLSRSNPPFIPRQGISFSCVLRARLKDEVGKHAHHSGEGKAVDLKRRGSARWGR